MLRTLKQEVRRAGLNCKKCDGCKRKPAECENWYLHKFRASCTIFGKGLVRNPLALLIRVCNFDAMAPEREWNHNHI